MAENRYAVGVDIGGTTVKNGLFDLEGNVIDKWEVPTRKEDGGSHILEDVAQAIKDKLAEHGADMSMLAGVGMGVPGPVDADGYVSRCVNLGWSGCIPQDEMSRLLGGVAVKSGNDANVAALGEAFKGAAAGEKNVVMLTLGTGVGGGVIVEGSILCGAHGAGGELGHVVVNPGETVQCNCGNYGCLEQYASATGVVRVTRNLLKEGVKDSCLKDDDSLSAKSVFDAAKAGDLLAMKAADVLCMYLGMACAQCAMTTDPDVFVIGGGVSRAGSILTDGISRHFERYSHLLPKKPEFRLAALGNDAGIYGAARLILQAL